MNPTPYLIALLCLVTLVTACHGAWRAALVCAGVALCVHVMHAASWQP